MITIAEPYFRFDRTPQADLATAARQLLLRAESRLLPHYQEKGIDASLLVQIELGSSNIWVKVGIPSLLLFLTEYGEIRHGVDYLIKDVRTVTELVEPALAEALGFDGDRPARIRRNTGVPGKLHSLFLAVERQEMSADQATNRAMALLEREEHQPTAQQRLPALRSQLEREFSRLPATRSIDDGFEDVGYVASTPPEAPRSPIPRRDRDAMAAESVGVRKKRGAIVERDQNGRIQVTDY